MNLNGIAIRGTNNYKGIVTLGTDITEGLTSTLKAVGDGMGGYSPLQLSSGQVAIKAPSFDLGMLDIYESQSTTTEYSGVRIRKADGVIRWQLLSDDTRDFTIYSGTNKSFSIPALMRNTYAIGLNQPLDDTLRAFTTGAATSPLELSTTQVQVSSVVFTSGVLNRNTNDSTGLRLFGGTLVTTADSGYIQLQGDTTNFGAPIFGLANGNFDSNFFRWERNGTEIARLTATGNFYLGAGSVTPSARLHVRGTVGTSVGCFETSSIAEIMTVGVSGGNTTRFNGAIRTDFINDYANGYTLLQHRSVGGVNIANGYNPVFSSGTNVSRGINFEYIINNTGGTNTVTGIYVNATEANLTGTQHNLMDLQRGGVSQFRVDRVGNLACGFAIDYGSNGEYIISSNNSGFTLFASNQGHTFGNTGGTVYHKFTSVGYIIGTGATNSSAFPMIKRNSATLEFKTADDIGYCGVTALSFTGNLFVGTTSGRMDFRGQYDISIAGGFTGGVGGVAISQGANATPHSSALLDIQSTTRGFLLPRMTESERDAIASPAEGLLIYNTTTQRINLFVTSWIAVH